MTQDPEGWAIQGRAQADTLPAERVQPLVTIITPCLNAVGTISETLMSVVQAQTALQRVHWELEHILIDGGSTDGTEDVVAKHASRYGFCRWINNITGGPYAAMNVGLQQARGRYAHVLNSDDLLLNPGAYVAFLQAGHRSKASVLLASIGYFRRPGRQIRSLWRVDPIPASAAEWRHQLAEGLHYPHPGFIADLETYRKQSFDETYSLSADYKLMQSILLTQPPEAPPMVCQLPLVAMAEGGATGNWKAVLQGWRQLDAINQELGIQASGVRRYWRKLKQRLRPLPQPILIPHLEVPES
ncbi:glycosyltransferase [Cyanobium gracile]|uniref:Glycosyltransferase n=1 Tax=Cyanobium gracile UHCC 0281 TaxID=3110309 RepID=A0ABU5SVY2_9CYAN|nr:glycosyltransferase [Cyanobium gracile]MEA5442672.1 glycosyltransferase [Cyanobium gracile UHCC 0281]